MFTELSDDSAVATFTLLTKEQRFYVDSRSGESGGVS